MVHLVPANDIFGASTEQARKHAGAWLGSTRDDSPLMEKSDDALVQQQFLTPIRSRRERVKIRK